MQRFLISLLVCPLVFACNDAPAPTDPAASRTTPEPSMLATAGTSHASLSRQAEELRRLERERLRSLVAADLETARRLHADDFQLINPAGVALTKEQYLGSIESGLLDYRAWEAGEIAVRIHGNTAVIRYQDIRFEVFFAGQLVHRGETYHTNYYEKRRGQWQVVWSHASGGEMISP
jgi:hypothetical protein